jgi:hypothetical protein
MCCPNVEAAVFDIQFIVMLLLGIAGVFASWAIYLDWADGPPTAGGG